MYITWKIPIYNILVSYGPFSPILYIYIYQWTVKKNYKMLHNNIIYIYTCKGVL